MKWFLRAPHWKIFLIQLSPALLIPFILLIFFASSNFNEFEPANFSILILIPLLIVGMVAFQLSYFWSIGNKLQPLLPEGLSMDPKYFNIALVVPLAGVVIIMMAVAVGILTADESFLEPEPFFGLSMVVMLFYMLFVLLAMLSGFYRIYFLAKLVKTLELQREVRFEEYLLECVLFWFYIAGIWIIQPKINEYVELLDNPPPAPPPLPASRD